MVRPIRFLLGRLLRFNVGCLSPLFRGVAQSEQLIDLTWLIATDEMTCMAHISRG